MATIVTTVTRELTLEVLAPLDGPATVPVVLRFATDDPWAVRATFLVGHGQQVIWLLARDLLEGGRRLVCGDGDVTIAPYDEDRLRIELRSPDGTADLLATDRDVAAFLRASYDVCPAGHEGAWVDWDAQLAAWTRPRHRQGKVPPGSTA